MAQWTAQWLVRLLLNKQVGRWVEGLDEKTLRVNLRSGFEVEDLSLKLDCLDGFALPFVIRKGTIKKLSVVWKTTTTALLCIDDLHISLGHANETMDTVDARTQRSKRKQLVRWEGLLRGMQHLVPDVGTQSDGYRNKILRGLVNNLEVRITRVHIHFADDACTFGVSIDAIRIQNEASSPVRNQNSTEGESVSSEHIDSDAGNSAEAPKQAKLQKTFEIDNFAVYVDVAQKGKRDSVASKSSDEPREKSNNVSVESPHSPHNESSADVHLDSISGRSGSVFRRRASTAADDDVFVDALEDHVPSDEEEDHEDATEDFESAVGSDEEERGVGGGVPADDGPWQGHHSFIVQPTSAVAHGTYYVDGTQDVGISVPNVRLTIDRSQYLGLADLFDDWSFRTRWNLPKPHRPTTGRPTDDPRGWWLFAIRSVTDRVRLASPQALAAWGVDRRRYIELYCHRARSGGTLKPQQHQDELDLLENRRSFQELVCFRCLALRQLCQVEEDSTDASDTKLLQADEEHAVPVSQQKQGWGSYLASFVYTTPTRGTELEDDSLILSESEQLELLTAFDLGDVGPWTSGKADSSKYCYRFKVDAATLTFQSLMHGCTQEEVKAQALRLGGEISGTAQTFHTKTTIGCFSLHDVREDRVVLSGGRLDGRDSTPLLTLTASTDWSVFPVEVSISMRSGRMGCVYHPMLWHRVWSFFSLKRSFDSTALRSAVADTYDLVAEPATSPSTSALARRISLDIDVSAPDICFPKPGLDSAIQSVVVHLGRLRVVGGAPLASAATSPNSPDDTVSGAGGGIGVSNAASSAHLDRVRNAYTINLENVSVKFVDRLDPECIRSCSLLEMDTTIISSLLSDLHVQVAADFSVPLYSTAALESTVAVQVFTCSLRSTSHQLTSTADIVGSLLWARSHPPSSAISFRPEPRMRGLLLVHGLPDRNGWFWRWCELHEDRIILSITATSKWPEHTLLLDSWRIYSEIDETLAVPCVFLRNTKRIVRSDRRGVSVITLLPPTDVRNDWITQLLLRQAEISHVGIPDEDEIVDYANVLVRTLSTQEPDRDQVPVRIKQPSSGLVLKLQLTSEDIVVQLDHDSFDTQTASEVLCRGVVTGLSASYVQDQHGLSCGLSARSLMIEDGANAGTDNDVDFGRLLVIEAPTQALDLQSKCSCDTSNTAFHVHTHIPLDATSPSEYSLDLHSSTVFVNPWSLGGLLGLLNTTRVTFGGAMRGIAAATCEAGSNSSHIESPTFVEPVSEPSLFHGAPDWVPLALLSPNLDTPIVSSRFSICLGSYSLILNQNRETKRQFGRLSLGHGLRVDGSVVDGCASVKGTIGSLTFTDMTPAGHLHRDIIAMQASDTLGTFEIVTFDRRCLSFPGHDMIVKFSVNETRITYLSRWITDLQTYTQMLRPATKTQVATTAWNDSVTHIAAPQEASRIRFIADLSHPTLIVPRSSVCSDALVADLGLISASNEFVELPSEDGCALSVLNVLSIEFRDVRLSTTRGADIVKDMGVVPHIGSAVRWPLIESSTSRMLELAMHFDIPTLDLEISDGQYEVIMGVAFENFTEFPAGWFDGIAKKVSTGKAPVSSVAELEQMRREAVDNSVAQRVDMRITVVVAEATVVCTFANIDQRESRPLARMSLRHVQLRSDMLLSDTDAGIGPVEDGRTPGLFWEFCLSAHEVSMMDIRPGFADRVLPLLTVTSAISAPDLVSNFWHSPEARGADPLGSDSTSCQAGFLYVKCVKTHHHHKYTDVQLGETNVLLDLYALWDILDFLNRGSAVGWRVFPTSFQVDGPPVVAYPSESEGAIIASFASQFARIYLMADFRQQVDLMHGILLQGNLSGVYSLTSSASTVWDITVKKFQALSGKFMPGRKDNAAVAREMLFPCKFQLIFTWKDGKPTTTLWEYKLEEPVLQVTYEDLLLISRVTWNVFWAEPPDLGLDLKQPPPTPSEADPHCAATHSVSLSTTSMIFVNDFQGRWTPLFSVNSDKIAWSRTTDYNGCGVEVGSKFESSIGAGLSWFVLGNAVWERVLEEQVLEIRGETRKGTRLMSINVRKHLRAQVSLPFIHSLLTCMQAWQSDRRPSAPFGTIDQSDDETLPIVETFYPKSIRNLTGVVLTCTVGAMRTKYCIESGATRGFTAREIPLAAGRPVQMWLQFGEEFDPILTVLADVNTDRTYLLKPCDGGSNSADAEPVWVRCVVALEGDTRVLTFSSMLVIVNSTGLPMEIRVVDKRDDESIAWPAMSKTLSKGDSWPVPLPLVVHGQLFLRCGLSSFHWTLASDSLSLREVATGRARLLQMCDADFEAHFRDSAPAQSRMFAAFQCSLTISRDGKQIGKTIAGRLFICDTCFAHSNVHGGVGSGQLMLTSAVNSIEKMQSGKGIAIHCADKSWVLRGFRFAGELEAAYRAVLREAQTKRLHTEKHPNVRPMKQLGVTERAVAVMGLGETEELVLCLPCVASSFDGREQGGHILATPVRACFLPDEGSLATPWIIPWSDVATVEGRNSKLFISDAIFFKTKHAGEVGGFQVSSGKWNRDEVLSVLRDLLTDCNSLVDGDEGASSQKGTIASLKSLGEKAFGNLASEASRKRSMLIENAETRLCNYFGLGSTTEILFCFECKLASDGSLHEGNMAASMTSLLFLSPNLSVAKRLTFDEMIALELAGNDGIKAEQADGVILEIHSVEWCATDVFEMIAAAWQSASGYQGDGRPRVVPRELPNYVDVSCPGERNIGDGTESHTITTADGRTVRIGPGLDPTGGAGADAAAAVAAVAAAEARKVTTAPAIESTRRSVGRERRGSVGSAIGAVGADRSALLDTSDVVDGATSDETLWYFHCTLHLDKVSHAGSVSGTPEGLCFISESSLGFATMLRWTEVTALHKRSTMLLLPNAIQVTARGGRGPMLLSAVRWNRDKVHSLMEEAWRRACPIENVGVQALTDSHTSNQVNRSDITADGEIYEFVVNCICMPSSEMGILSGSSLKICVLPTDGCGKCHWATSWTNIVAIEPVSDDSVAIDENTGNRHLFCGFDKPRHTVITRLVALWQAFMDRSATDATCPVPRTTPVPDEFVVMQLEGGSRSASASPSPRSSRSASASVGIASPSSVLAPDCDPIALDNVVDDSLEFSTQLGPGGGVVMVEKPTSDGISFSQEHSLISKSPPSRLRKSIGGAFRSLHLPFGSTETASTQQRPGNEASSEEVDHRLAVAFGFKLDNDEDDQRETILLTFPCRLHVDGSEHRGHVATTKERVCFLSRDGSVSRSLPWTDVDEISPKSTMLVRAIGIRIVARDQHSSLFLTSGRWNRDLVCTLFTNAWHGSVPQYDATASANTADDLRPLTVTSLNTNPDAPPFVCCVACEGAAGGEWVRCRPARFMLLPTLVFKNRLAESCELVWGQTKQEVLTAPKDAWMVVSSGASLDLSADFRWSVWVRVRFVGVTWPLSKPVRVYTPGRPKEGATRFLPTVKAGTIPVSIAMQHKRHGTMHVCISSRYWLLNTLHTPLECRFLSESKKPGRPIIVPPMERPLDFDFPDPDVHIKNYVQLRFANSKAVIEHSWDGSESSSERVAAVPMSSDTSWSVSLNPQKLLGRPVWCVLHQGDEEVASSRSIRHTSIARKNKDDIQKGGSDTSRYLGVSASTAEGSFWRTTCVSIAAPVILLNVYEHEIDVVQWSEDGPIGSLVTVASNESAPFLCVGHPQNLWLKIRKGSLADWSTPFLGTAIGDTWIHVPSEGTSIDTTAAPLVQNLVCTRVAPVRGTMTMQVRFSSAESLSSPFRVENKSSAPVRFRQRLAATDKAAHNNAWRFVESGQASHVIWANPCVSQLELELETGAPARMAYVDMRNLDSQPKLDGPQVSGVLLDGGGVVTTWASLGLVGTSFTLTVNDVITDLPPIVSMTDVASPYASRRRSWSLRTEDVPALLRRGSSQIEQAAVTAPPPEPQGNLNVAITLAGLGLLIVAGPGGEIGKETASVQSGESEALFRLYVSTGECSIAHSSTAAKRQVIVQIEGLQVDDESTPTSSYPVLLHAEPLEARRSTGPCLSFMVSERLGHTGITFIERFELRLGALHLSIHDAFLAKASAALASALAFRATIGGSPQVAEQNAVLAQGDTTPAESSTGAGHVQQSVLLLGVPRHIDVLLQRHLSSEDTNFEAGLQFYVENLSIESLTLHLVILIEGLPQDSGHEVFDLGRTIGPVRKFITGVPLDLSFTARPLSQQRLLRTPHQLGHMFAAHYGEEAMKQVWQVGKKALKGVLTSWTRRGGKSGSDSVGRRRVRDNFGGGEN